MNSVLTVREKDKAVILAAVRRFGPVSRVGIHNLTRLRPATISLLVRELVADRKLKVVGRADNPMGRKQVLLSINQESGFVIGLDFDEEFIDAALLDLRPTIKYSIREATNVSSGVEGLVAQLLACVWKVIRQSDLDLRHIQGIGVGVPGLVNSRNGTVMMSSTIDFWKQVELKQLFEKEFGVSTEVENNARTKAVAERVLGAGGGAKDMIFAEYGKGIGAGIIVGGRVLHGHSFSAGELGHTHIVENGPACNCGSFGCLEAIASVSAIESRVRKALEGGGYSGRLEFSGGDPHSMSGWNVLEAAKMGDKLCVAITEELGRYLGLALANLVNLFNPSVVVLDYRLEAAGQQLLDQVSRVVRAQALSHATQDLDIRFGKLGPQVGVIGAALLITERIFEVPLLKPPKFMMDAGGPASPNARVQGEADQASGGTSATTLS